MYRRKQRERTMPRQRSPVSILGTSCVFWMQMNRFTVATGVSLIPDLAKGSAQDAVQATAGAQPTTFGLSAGTGHYFVKGDGTDDTLLAPLSTPITTISRPYVWVVARWPTLPAGVAHGAGGYSSADGLLVVAPLRITATDFTCILVSSDTGAGEIITGPARNTNVHLFEAGFLTSGTGRFVVDGTAYNGTNTGGPFRDLDRMRLYAINNPVTGFAAVELYELVLADALPNAAQLLAMRQMFRERGYGMAIA